ncbi:putative RING-H2 finger protein ATL69 [Typha latifolia]|uniref:putative RING-H2 finger protein ATL69 n=1 Tax=Typha latifolia TaxID=4733 RepID=UPI003C2F39BA
MSSSTFFSSSPVGATSSGVGLGYGIAIAVGILVLVSTIMLASYICVRAKGGAAASDSTPPLPRHHSTAHVAVPGLDGPTIDAFYPKFFYEGDSGEEQPCPICLGEYGAGDLLRRGPDCGHRFHAACADAWLRVSGTCPMCRRSPVNSPAPTPLATPLSELIPLAVHAR